MEAGATVSNRLWLELLHAEVCWALADRGLDVLVIKGPSISSWLYADGERESADVDVLLRPSQWDAAVAVLGARGFEPTYTGFRDDETALHSLDLRRTDPAQGLHGLDLHHYFPGIEVDPEDAFDVLWKGRLPGMQAGIPVWFPGLEARVLIIALHAARQPEQPKTREDLRRAMAALTSTQVEAVASLAQRLDARAALRAGLETIPETAEYVGQLGLTDVEVPPHWVLLSQGADLLPIELERVWSLPPGARARQLGRWLLPSPASMRARHPDIGQGHARLVGAYVRRFGSGLRRLPRAVGDIRSARQLPDRADSAGPASQQDVHRTET